MKEFPRHIQIHTLHGFPAVLLNRDDAGLAKRLVYGGASRTRISSQCLKRHWRTADSPFAIERIETVPGSVRSRQTIARRVIEPLTEAGYPKDITDVIEKGFNAAVYGKEDKGNRQTLLLGDQEIDYLAKEARRVAKKHGRSVDKIKTGMAAWARDAQANLRAMREACAVPGGVWSTIGGRFVTSDPAANVDAALHVAHSFTVHREETEGDWFSVVDDLHRPGTDPAADHLGETELTSGLYYGFVVIDRHKLIENLAGDTTSAGEIARRLIHLIATVTPGAKLGGTAPYSYASWMLVEAGDNQPRSLAEGFRKPVEEGTTAAAVAAATRRMAQCDEAYGNTNERRVMVLEETAESNGTQRVKTLEELANWIATVVAEGIR